MLRSPSAAILATSQGDCARVWTSKFVSIDYDRTQCRSLWIDSDRADSQQLDLYQMEVPNSPGLSFSRSADLLPRPRHLLQPSCSGLWHVLETHCSGRLIPVLRTRGWLERSARLVEPDIQSSSEVRWNSTKSVTIKHTNHSFIDASASLIVRDKDVYITWWHRLEYV